MGNRISIESLQAHMDQRSVPVTESGCFIWLAGTDRRGYGNIKAVCIGGFHKAHRAAYILAYGPIPEGKIICHKCDTPSCINPSHLYAGTHAENTADRQRRGRQNATASLGENNLNAKLDRDRVNAILMDKRSYRTIGREFGISSSGVSRIKGGRIWKSV